MSSFLPLLKCIDGELDLYLVYEANEHFDIFPAYVAYCGRQPLTKYLHYIYLLIASIPLEIATYAIFQLQLDRPTVMLLRTYLSCTLAEKRHVLGSTCSNWRLFLRDARIDHAAAIP